MKKIFSVLVFILYLLLLFAIGIAAVEMLARHLRPNLLHSPREREKFCRYDPEIGWVHKPSVAGVFESRDFKVDIQINSKGLRDSGEPAYEKSPGKFRVAVFGDSFTWGFGVEAHETFAERLESALPQTEALNFGCSGYGQDQELLLLKREGVKYQPDLVIAMVHMASDFDNNSAFFQYGFYKPFFKYENAALHLENVPVPKETAGIAVNNWLLDRFVSWRILGNRRMGAVDLASAAVAVADGKTSLIGSANRNLPSAQLTCFLCAEIKKQTDAIQGQTLFVLSPNLILPQSGQKNKIMPEDSRYAALRQCLQEKGMEILDLRPIFETQLIREPEVKLTFDHDAHWNAKGHEVVAKAIQQAIQEKTAPKA